MHKIKNADTFSESGIHQQANRSEDIVQPLPAGQDDLLHRLWHQYVPISNGAILAASLGINILALALPLLILQVYNRILPYEGLSTLAMLSIGVAIALVLDVLLKITRARLSGWAGAQYEHRAGCIAIKRLATGDLAHVESTPSGMHLDRLSSIELIRDFYASQASLVLIDLPFILLFLGILALITGWLVLIPIIMLGIAGFMAWKIGKSLQDRLEDRREWDRRRYSFLIEVLSGIHTVKAMAMEAMMLRRYERLLESNAFASAQVSQISGHAQTVGTITSHLTVAAVVGFGSLMVINGTLSVGALAASTLLAGRTVQPALRALGLWSRFQSVSLAEDNLRDIDAIPAESRGRFKMDRFASLDLKNLHFRYSPDDPEVLRNINLRLEQQIIGITGKNGVGKSTLLNLVAGQIVPTKGTALLNGQPPHDFDAESVFNQISYIPQRPTLFHGTILDNLTMFRSDEVDIMQRALELAAKLHLDEVFARLPNGYDTEVGDSSADLLPAGVAQRITIVRALINRPSLILFDESNTSLDGYSDRALCDLMRSLKGSVSMILVSYRPSLLALADQRFSLEDGRLKPLDSAAMATSQGKLSRTNENSGHSQPPASPKGHP